MDGNGFDGSYSDSRFAFLKLMFQKKSKFKFKYIKQEPRNSLPEVDVLQFSNGNIDLRSSHY